MLKGWRKVNSPQAAVALAVSLNLLYLWAIISYLEFSELACLVLITWMSASLLVAAVSFALRRLFRPLGHSMATLLLLLTLTALQFHSAEPIRVEGRWLLRSSSYKSKLFTQDHSQPGGLRHIEWGGWGWAGSDTNVYLVYDPSDQLGRADTTDLPCPAWQVHRLERQWYSVVFYTDESWEHCQ